MNFIIEEVLKKIEVCSFIPVSTIIPKEWRLWFWEAVTETTPSFSWGDCNRSMVTASEFRRHIEEALDVDEPDVDSGESLSDKLDGRNFTYEEYSSYITFLENLGELYIDLEN